MTDDTESPETLYFAAMKWLMDRGPTTSNQFLKGLYKQVVRWLEDQDRPEPLSPRQSELLIQNYQRWWDNQRLKKLFRGQPQ